MHAPIPQISAGGVIYRHWRDRFEFALILRLTARGQAVWCLPKGLVEKGESFRETAQREVREETGLSGKVIGELGEVRYTFYSPRERSRIQKTVHFFLMEYRDGSVEDHDHEVEEARWFPVGEALRTLAYETERQIAQKALQTISQPTVLGESGDA